MSCCPHCKQPVFRKSASGAKLKARTKILVLHKSGDVEITCNACGKGVLVPLEMKADHELRPALSPKLVVRKT